MDGHFTAQYKPKTMSTEELIEKQQRQFAGYKQKSVATILKSINEQIIDTRQMISPIFSGHLGENIKHNSENLMQLFKVLPSSD